MFLSSSPYYSFFFYLSIVPSSFLSSLTVSASPIVLPLPLAVPFALPFSLQLRNLDVRNALPQGVPQAVSLHPRNPIPQAVVDAIAPPAENPPPGCVRNWSGTFGIAIVNVSREGEGGGVERREVEKRELEKRLCSESPPSSTPPPPAPTMINVISPVSQIPDGQIQAPPPPTPQPSIPNSIMTVAQVSQIADGQVQGGMHTVELIAMPTDSAGGGGGGGGGGGRWVPVGLGSAGELGGEVLDPLPPAEGGVAGGAAVNHSLPSVSSPSSSPSNTNATSSSPSSDQQGESEDNTTYNNNISDANADANAEAEVNQPISLVSCLTPSTLSLTLSDGILTDSHGRTGYIASNFQFQFDGPPQSQALFTAGWSVCSGGGGDKANSGGAVGGDFGEGEYLALGNQTTFWQCLSGEFYNLYDRYWASQCGEVRVRLVELVDC